MARRKRDGLLIVGGGLAGSLAALAMAEQRPEVPILLIEESDRFGGSDVWSFLDSEIAEADRWLIDPLVSHHWPAYYVAFPRQPGRIELGYSSILSADLDRLVRERLRPDQYRLGSKVVAVRDSEVVLPGGEVIRADAAIDARGAAHLSMLDLGWRRFVRRDYTFSKPHKVDLPVLIDATVDQVEGYRFFHLLPLSETRLLVEDTYISDTPEFDRKAIGTRIEAYLQLRGWRGGKYKGEQSGALPLALSDDVQAFWRGGGARVAKIGTRGGFFHPSTGCSLADAVRCATLLTAQRELEGAQLHDLFEAEAEKIWRKRELHRAFNAALFDRPVWERREQMADFYRLDPGLIARFHAGNLGMMDRMRLSSIKPPKARR